jgi:hypothetical protein
VGEHARHFANAAIRAPNHLVIGFAEEYTFSKSICDTPEQRGKFERVLAELTGQRVRLEFEALNNQESPQGEAPAARAKSVMQRRAEVAEHPMVRRAMELFGAFPERVEEPGGTG